MTNSHKQHNHSLQNLSKLVLFFQLELEFKVSCIVKTTLKNVVGTLEKTKFGVI